MDINSYLGFTLIKRKSKRYPAVHITDIYFTDDIAVITNSLIDANTLLHNIEDTAKYIGLRIYSDNRKYMNKV